MKKEYGLEQIEKDDTSLVTVGIYDGVHVGHQAILRYLVRRAQQRNGRSVVLSFDPHPREVLSGQELGVLSTIDERAQMLETLGLDRFIVLPFTKAFAALPPEDFVRQILVGRIGLQEIVVGHDHGFGRGRQGNVDLLQTMGGQHNFTVDVIPAQAVDHQVVSSSAIRHLLTEEGDVGRSAEMLGRRYALTGTVIHGDGRGHSIGYPTANIEVNHPRKVIPKRGVYVVQVRLFPASLPVIPWFSREGGRKAGTSSRLPPAYAGESGSIGEHQGTTGEEHVYGGMMNIGYRPTFEGDNTLHLEVHLFDFARTIYGHSLRIAFVERLRDEQKFGSVDELIAQLADDEQRARRVLTPNSDDSLS